jgi:N6-adenosine-specific RNA methylase IME4
MQIVIDNEFRRIIPALLPEEFKQLEANILQDGEIKSPLIIWNDVLLDGHNRYVIAEKHGLTFKTSEILLTDRDHAKLWIATHQLGRRSLTDDQRSTVSNDVREIRSEIEKKERAQKAASQPSEKTRLARPSSSVKSADKLTSVKPLESTPKDSRKAVAKEAKLPERKIRQAQEIKKASPAVYDMVKDGDVSLVEGKRIVSLPPEARKIAIDAVKTDIHDGNKPDVRSAIRAAKKEDYNAAIAFAKPKELEGTYRILYADPPWKYVGLNQADEYGHAERHYDCLDDEQLKKYKVGDRHVKDMMDKNSVLFLWVTSPLLERCFPIIEAWGFEYKSSFVWDKVKHNMGHYNSVRHELLLVCVRGACKPDVSRLVDSVQSIERSNRHSEKPEEFRKIIENLYDHGRRLELFHRGKAPEGWDAIGNEAA